MMSPLSQATASNVAQYKAKLETFNQITQQSLEKQTQSLTSLVSSQTQAEQIMTQGLSSNGGRVDIQV